MARENPVEDLSEEVLVAIQGGGVTSYPSFSGGVFVASGDVNGDGAARMSCSNNLKQIGLGIHN